MTSRPRRAADRSFATLGLLVVLALASSAWPPPALASDGAWFAIATGHYFRDSCAVAFDSRRGHALAFGGTLVSQGSGGVTYRSDLDSTLALSLDDGLAFDALALSGAGPSARALAAMAFDSTADRLWLFGGRGLQVTYVSIVPTYAPLPRGDLWVLDRGAPSPGWQSVTPSGAGPAARYGHALVMDEEQRALWLLGGRDSAGHAFVDLWKLDLAQVPPAWSAIAVPGPSPRGRWNFATAFDPVTRRLYLVGGQSGSTWLADAWALDLSGTPHWDSLAATGAPPVPATGGAWDRRRNRVLAYSPVAGLRALDVTVAPPAWSTLALDALPSVAPGATTICARLTYDPSRDLALLPFSDVVGRTFFGNTSRHHVVAFPQAPPPVTQAPELIAYSPAQGVWRSTWRLHSDAGLRYQRPLLQRPAWGSPWWTLGGPVAFDAVADTGVWLDDNPANEPVTSWRLAWSDPYATHTGASYTIAVPPAPVDMDATVDSAFVAGGAMHLQWTLGDDSLSWIARPAVGRRIPGGSWVELAPVWPDSARRVRYLDASIAGGTDYEYRLEWRCGADTCWTGPVTSAATPPAPVLAERRQPGLGTYMRWTIGGAAPFTARVYRALGSGAGWAPWDSVVASPARDLVVAERALPLGTHVSYRLGWTDGGVEAFTAAVVYDVPLFSADVTDYRHGTRFVSFTWSLWPVDSLLAIRVWRAPVAGTPVTLLAGPLPGSPAAFTWTDTTVASGTEYGYFLTADDGSTPVETGGSVGGFADNRPVVTSAGVTPGGQVVIAWSASTAAVGYALWKRVDAGPLIHVADDPPGASTYLHGEPPPAGADSVTYEVRWQESDQRWLALRDTTIQLAGTTGTPLRASLSLASASPAIDGMALQFAVPDAAPATVRLFDVRGRERLAHTSAGPGTFTWTIPRGTLEPGVYWARYRHGAYERSMRVVVLR
jgi:hypothetical protein